MKPVVAVDRISAHDFRHEFVNTQTPVLIRKMTEQWPALGSWNFDYFRSIDKGLRLPMKKGDVSEGKRETMLLSQYVDLLENYDQQQKRGNAGAAPPYLHDVPIFHLLPSLIRDVEPFPLELFPKWYWNKWYNYVQFFMGATGSLTPLHFDTLYTHNLFFQVAGRKRFMLIKPSDKDSCYIHGWRWSKFNPDKPDFEKFPRAKNVEIMDVELGPGDILFMPSGTLHQVHGLSFSISFNIDWHTLSSARKGVMSLFEGAPMKNIYYNSLILGGLALKMPSKYIFPYYKSYLNYVS